MNIEDKQINEFELNLFWEHQAFLGSDHPDLPPGLGPLGPSYEASFLGETPQTPLVSLRSGLRMVK